MQHMLVDLHEKVVVKSLFCLGVCALFYPIPFHNQNMASCFWTSFSTHFDMFVSVASDFCSCSCLRASLKSFPCKYMINFLCSSTLLGHPGFWTICGIWSTCRQGIIHVHVSEILCSLLYTNYSHTCRHRAAHHPMGGFQPYPAFVSSPVGAFFTIWPPVRGGQNPPAPKRQIICDNSSILTVDNNNRSSKFKIIITKY